MGVLSHENFSPPVSSSLFLLLSFFLALNFSQAFLFDQLITINHDRHLRLLQSCSTLLRKTLTADHYGLGPPGVDATG